VAILKDPKYRDFYNEKKPAIDGLNVWLVFMEPKWVPNRNALKKELRKEL